MRNYTGCDACATTRDADRFVRCNLAATSRTERFGEEPAGAPLVRLHRLQLPQVLHSLLVRHGGGDEVAAANAERGYRMNAQLPPTGVKRARLRGGG